MRDFRAGRVVLGASLLACGAPSTPIAPTNPVVAPAAADAGSAASPTLPPSLRIAAVSFDRAHLEWQKDRITFDAGIFVYEARPRGLVLGGKIADYADKTFGDDLVGFGTHPPALRGAPVHTGPDYFSDDKRRCALVPSANEGEYGTCSDLPFGTLSTAREHLGPPYWRGRFVAEPRSHVEGLTYDAPMAVARDGALWFATDARVHRVAVDGTRTSFDLPSPEPSLVRPYLMGENPWSMSAVHDGDRYWQSTQLEPAPSELAANGVLQFAPGSDGSMWIQAHASPKDGRWGTRFSIVYRYGSGDLVPLTVGTVFDQQVEIRNAMRIRPWEASCPQAFVMEIASDESPLASADLAKALADARKKRIAAAIVEGTLGERRVRGVFLHHAAPRVDQKQFVALVASIVKLTGGQPSCSVPIVTKTLEGVRGR